MERSEAERPSRSHRITQEELAAALKAIRLVPHRMIGGQGGSSGHYERDHDAYAAALVARVLANRRAR